MQIGTSAVATLAATLPTAVAAPDVTVLTSDETHGKMVIGQLDGNDLDSRKKHSFCFQGLQVGTGQHRYLPVVVARDATTGKRILLISGVLGAEVSRAGGTSLCRDFSL
jgi:hypothetical protein